MKIDQLKNRRKNVRNDKLMYSVIMLPTSSVLLTSICLFICICISEPCTDEKTDCPQRAAKGYCWSTADPPIRNPTTYFVDRTFPEWVKCKKSCRRCNSKAWKAKRVQQTNTCHHSYTNDKYRCNWPSKTQRQHFILRLLSYSCANLSAPDRSNPILLVGKFKVESYKL